MSRPFAWLLISLPFYLLANRKLSAYLKLAVPGNATEPQQ